MKIVAYFRFYLPYVLPRERNWFEAGHQHLGFTINGHKVVIHPRNPDEPLFPTDEMDQEVLHLTVTIPTPEIEVKDFPASLAVKDRCFDRIDALVFGEISSSDDVLSEGTRLEYLKIAGHACNEVLSHCRVVGRDPDIRGIEWHFNFSDKNYYIQQPYSVVWCREENGQPVERLRDSNGNLLEGAASGGIMSPTRNPISLEAVVQSLAQKKPPNLSVSLLVEAKGLIAMERLQEGVIDLGSALEISSKQYVYRKGRASDPKVEEIVKARASFAERRFHRLPKYLDKRSLKKEDPHSFDLIEKLYRTRNHLTHDGAMVFNYDGKETKVDGVLVHRFWDATEVAVDWLTSL